MKRLLLFFIASIGMMACGDDIPVQKNQEKNVEFSTVFQSDFFNKEYKPNDSVTVQVFNNQESWSVFLHNFKYNIVSEVIDFEKNTIVAVIDKNQPSGGYDFKVVGLTDNGSSIKINVSSFVNGIWQSPSRPIHIVKIPKTNKNLELQMNFING